MRHTVSMTRTRQSLATAARSAFADAPPVSIVGEHDRMGTVVFAQFLALADGLAEFRRESVESDVTYAETAMAFAELGWTVEMHLVTGQDHDTLLSIPTKHGPATAIVCADDRWGDWDFQVVAASTAAADAAREALLALVPPMSQSAGDRVNVNFWMHDKMMGGVSINRKLDRLGWDDIAANYPAATRETLSGLSALTGCMPKGRLAVFHGPPGTGKTRFLQSLAASWSDWCDVHYIVDPDEMFNSATYLYRVMLGDYSNDERWRLVVIEDGDEFIATDGKQRSGAAVSRLLNVADGLIGQGLKVMVLVSTNVEELAFNAAVMRSGRCGAQVEFPYFSADEADEWLSAREVDADLGDAESVPLSDLYAFASE